MPAMTVQDKAQEALSWFETAKREGQDESYFRARDGAPEWVRELVWAAHGDMLPDDWRYRIIFGAIEFIADSDDPEDGSGEFADLAVDVYTSARLEWLGSNLNRAGYCDEAMEEGLADPKAGVIELIGAGQYMEANEIYSLVLRALED